MDQEIITTVCGICDAGCAVKVYLDDGVMSRIAPSNGHPYGSCCIRGMHAPEIVYSPDRLRYPLKRIAPKGKGARGDSREIMACFQRISWEEALEETANSLRAVAERHGPQALCMYTGRGNFEQSLCDIFSPAGVAESSASSLLFPLGSPNTTGVGAICYVAHGFIAPQATFGAYRKQMFNDLERSELIVVWGANPAGVSPTTLRPLLEAGRRGATIVVIDHRCSQTAKATKGRWIAIRPGTDGALALSMIHVLIEEELFDRQFAEQWTVGFDELRDYVRQFPPEHAESITRVPATTIRELARSIAAAKGAALIEYSGLEYTNSGVQNIRATQILWALAGQLDVPGGLCFKMPDSDFAVNDRRVAPPAQPDPIGKDRYPLYHLFRKEAHAMELPRAILEGEPYPIRAMIIGGSSIITGYPQPDLWRRSFERLEFLAVVDRFLTADAAYADIILPATTMFEIESYVLHGPLIQHRPKTVPPQGEARNDFLIYAELARRLGYGHLYPQSEEAMLRQALEGTGVDLETLQAAVDGVVKAPAPMVHRKWEKGLLRGDGQPGFETPSGKMEIASSLLASYGYEALPVYVEPVEGPLAAPELARRYPLVFNSGARFQYSFRSQHHNIPGLLKKHPEPLVMLHPQDAAPRGIADGDRVLVETPRGRAPFKAWVTEEILPGVIEANAGGGGPIASEAWRNANVNDLTDHDNRDPISGFPVYKALLCQVTKA